MSGITEEIDNLLAAVGGEAWLAGDHLSPLGGRHAIEQLAEFMQLSMEATATAADRDVGAEGDAFTEREFAIERVRGEVGSAVAGNGKDKS